MTHRFHWLVRFRRFVPGWLLIVAGCLPGVSGADWVRGFGFRSRELPVPATGRTGFTALTPSQTGITFTNHLSEAAAARNRVLENGSGVALGDVDGDGLCDIYFCRLEGPNVLYRNLGDWKFEDITARAGVACADQFSTGAVIADVEGDGDMDLLVTGVGVGTRLYVNDGHGVFQWEPQAGLLGRFTGTSLSLADLEGDGDLDLYVANYRTTNYKDRPPGVQPQAKLVQGQLVVTPEDRFSGVITDDGSSFVLIEKGEPDILYINKGIRRFGPASWTGGAFADAAGNKLTAAPLDWGLSALFRDLNGDQTPDLYVCNDFMFSRDRVWLNEGGQRFRSAPTGAFRSMSLSSMAVDVADINRDGLDDILVVDMLSRDPRLRQRQRPNLLVGKVTAPKWDPDYVPEVPRNTLFLNRGDGTYAEIAQLAGLDATEWSWGVAFLDVDLDGFEDVLVTNGNDHDVLDADVHREIAAGAASAAGDRHAENLLKFPRLNSTNLVFRNRGDLTFEPMSEAWGFNQVGISHGMALADLDNDGDLDVVVNNLHSAAGIYRNESIAPRITVRLRGTPPNQFATGARVEVRGGAIPRQSQCFVTGGRYLSGDAPHRSFAAGSLTNDMTIEITWRDGRRSVVEHAQANRLYDITQEFAKHVPESTPAAPTKPLFADWTSNLGHRHVDNPLPELNGPESLIHGVSHRGPGMSAVDWNGDGLDDLAIAGGNGGWLGLYLNNGKGGFTVATNNSPAAPLGEQRSVLGWNSGGTGQAFLVGLASADGGTNRVATWMRSPASNASGTPTMTGNAGPMALADIDGDGDLDLFVGGGVIPNRYPSCTPSQLYRRTETAWALDAENSALLNASGVLNGAVFSDLNGDGFPELVLASEWGGIRVLLNEGGHFRDVSTAAGLEESTGFWTGVAAGDFDGDGRLDLAVGNWGRNTRFEAVLHHPLELTFGPVGGQGPWLAVESFFSSMQGKYVPWRDLEALSRVLLDLPDRFPTFKAFGDASMRDLLQGHDASLKRLQVRELRSTVWLNRWPRFEARALPLEAQMAPVFGITVADANGDGLEDLFLAQNFFQTEPETSRYDAGLGLLLRGDGRGGFSAVSARDSGIRVPGQQRGAVAADFDRDGRVDWCVAQNNGATCVFHNEMAKPGVRVRLNAGAGNPDGIGAVVRVESADRSLGPAREIHAGSGYASQDSPVTILAVPSQPKALVVQWPGGKSTRHPWVTGSLEVECRADGGTRKVLP